MSNQTFVKKDRISFAQNLNEQTVIAPFTSNSIYLGPNTAITYDTLSNVQTIENLAGVTLSNQYIYADGTFISNLQPGNISGWAYYPALSNVDMSGNDIINALHVYSAEVTTGNTITESLYGSGIGNIINVRNNIDMNNNVIGSINQITFYDGSAQNTSADNIVQSTIIGLGTFGYLSTNTGGGGITQSNLNSSITGLGSVGYISTSQLISTVTGLGNIYLSSGLTSTIIGLGTFGYISSATLQSTVIGLGTFGYLSTSSVPSTIVGLGTFGYLSTSQLTSTVRGLGTFGYVSSSQLISTVRGLGNIYLSTNIIPSTIVGLGTFGYVSTSQLTSTVRGLGTFGYISSSQLISSLSNWSLYPAKSTVDISANIISNVDTILVDTISSATSGYTQFLNSVNFQNNRIYAVNSLQVDSFNPNNYGIIRFDGSVDMNLQSIDNINTAYFSYPITTYKDGLYMTEYTPPDNSIRSPALGLYANGIPFVGTSADTSCVNLYNVSKTYFCDGGVPTSFANAIFSCNGIFYYSNVGSGISNPIGGGGDASLWANYPAVSNVDMNNNMISNASGVESSYVSMDTLYGLTNPFISAYVSINFNNNSLSNISSLGFYDVVTPSSNSVLHCSNSLLYYNNSNEIIGGTLQYLPQLISFAPFTPRDIPYLGLWLDAADPTTFNLDGGYAYQWYDKSQNANTFTTNSTYPYYNGNSLLFDGSCYMASTNPLTFDTNTYIFMVASINNTSFEMAFVLNDINDGDYSLRYVSNIYHNADTGDALFPTYVANGYINGTVDFTQTHIIEGFFNSGGTSIMRLSSDFMDRYFLGNMNEIIIYNGPSQITPAQVLQVRNYLTTKWSINTI